MAKEPVYVPLGWDNYPTTEELRIVAGVLRAAPCPTECVGVVERFCAKIDAAVEQAERVHQREGGQ